MSWEIGFLTPMFGGGVTINPAFKHRKLPDAVTPVRVSSIKGQLRFWWRAAIGSTMDSIEAMRTKEAELFGSTKNRSDLEIYISRKNSIVSKSIEAKSALAYATFPLRPDRGVRDRDGKLTQFGGSFVLTATFATEHKDAVERTVETWLALGGLGGRTRRGFGALHGGKWKLEDVLNVSSSNNKSLPGVPSLCKAFYEKKQFRNADEAHQTLVKKLKDFRQGEKIGKSLWPEPDEIRRITKRHDRKHSPRHPVRKFPRGQFGMPIIFHFKSDSDPDEVTLLPIGLDRLASPLILRPWRDPKSDKFLAIALVLTNSERHPPHGAGNW